MSKTSQANKPKKFIGIGPILCFIIIVIASCLGVWYYVNKENNNISFTKDTFPRVDSSLATQPLMDAFVKEYTGETTSNLGIVYSNTHPAYLKLIDNETDLIIVTEPSSDETSYAKAKNVELEVTKVVNEGFTFFVNKNNKVDTLTMDQIVSIYSGKVTNWKEVGGSDEEIIAYQRNTNSGSQTALLNLVMKGVEPKEFTEKENVDLGMAGIVDYVADYNNGQGAIGFGFYYYANVMYKNDNLKYIKVNGVEPNETTIKNGSYPIRSAYYIVTRKNDDNENVNLLKNVMLSTRGQKVASGAGYVPIK